jgi:hypothetical protein
VLQQRRGIVAVVGKERDADARGDRDLLFADQDSSSEQFLYSLCDHAGGLGGVDIGQNDSELVAAKTCEVQARFVQRRPGNEGACAQPFLQAVGDGLQQAVAGTVPKRVVDPLEAVQVEKQQRYPAIRPACAQQFAVETFEKTLPVWQAGLSK